MGSLAFGDVDNDGDLDLVFSGSYSTNFYDNIYRNNGTSLIGNSNPGCDPCALWGWSSIILGDYDNDLDLDLAYMGTKTGDWFYIYNNTNGSFIQSQAIGDYFDGSIAFGDYDNDGHLDLAAMGKETGRDRIWKNNHSFFEIDASASVNMQSDDMQQGSLAWIDINNDSSLDLVINGKQGDTSTFLFKVYISNASLTKNNTKPNPPLTGFSASYVNNILTLKWDNASDAETDTLGLYYNLMVGNSSTNNTIVSGVFGGSSNPTAGYFGNMMQRRNISLNVVLDANKTYYWYVQTIDTGLAKSNWSAVQSFTTEIDITKPTIAIQNPSPNSSLHTINPFFVFNASVADSNLSNVSLYSTWKTDAFTINETNSSGINTFYIFNKNLTTYSDGHYSWYILACDAYSNCQQTDTQDFYLDRAYPKIYLNSPDNALTWTSSSTVTFSYNVSDTDIANCSLIIDNVVQQTNEGNTTLTFAKVLGNAVYNWSINCTDYVGYTNNSETRMLIVSYTAPAGGDTGGSTSPSSSPGGGAPDFWLATFYAPNNISSGYTIGLAARWRARMNVSGEYYYVGVTSLTNTTAIINVSSVSQQKTLLIGDEWKIDIGNDGYYDLIVRLNNIINNRANLTIKSIHEQTVVEKETEQMPETKTETEFKLWMVAGFVAVCAAIIVLIKIFGKKNGRSKNR